MNLIDRLVAYFSPVQGMKRAMARQALLSLRGYDSAKIDRVHGRRTSDKSANAEALGKLKTIRGRSRDLCRNNAFAAGAIDVIVNNVVGDGIVPQGRITLPGETTPDKELNSLVEDGFATWAERADITGRLHFYELQQLYQRQKIQDGEAVAVFSQVRDPSRVIPLAVEIIESDRIAEKNEEFRGGGRVVQGVEFDAQGLPVAYWIYPNHPGDGALARLEPRRIPANRVIHDFRMLRPEQARGVPWYSPVVNYFEAIGEYLDYELTAARVAACLAAFITTEHGAGLPGLATSEDTEDSDGNDLMELRAGMIARLRPGESVNVVNPNRPGSNLAPFVILMLRSIAAGIGISYEVLARDWTQTNFSSSRSAALEDRRSWRPMQGAINRKFNGPVAFEAVFQLWARGRIDLPSTILIDKLLAFKWHPPGWEWVDPVKEVSADLLAVQAGFKTRSEVCAQRGRDFEDVIAELAREEQLTSEAGVELVSAAKQDGSQAEGEEDNGDEDDQQTKSAVATAASAA